MIISEGFVQWNLFWNVDVVAINSGFQVHNRLEGTPSYFVIQFDLPGCDKVGWVYRHKKIKWNLTETVEVGNNYDLDSCKPSIFSMELIFLLTLDKIPLINKEQNGWVFKGAP